MKNKELFIFIIFITICLSLFFAGTVVFPLNQTINYTTITSGVTSLNFGTYTTVKNTPTASDTYITTVPAAGTECNLIVVTSGVTSYTMTFGIGFLSTGTLVSGVTTAKTFTLHFISDGTTLFEESRTTAM